MKILLIVSALILWVPAYAEDTAGKPIRVALYADVGTGESKEKVAAALTDSPTGGFVVEKVTAAEIQEGKLSEVDVLIHPGGSGSKQGKALGPEGRSEVRKFVERGGGFVGICAGSYLATNDYDWSLALIDARVLDRRHWNRGNGPVVVRFSEAGKSAVEAESEEVTIYYAQGPLLARREWDDPATPDYESLAIFQTEIAEKGAPKGIMPGTTAIARAEFGEGRVFCFSPHPELTEGLGGYLVRAVRWAASR